MSNLVPEPHECWEAFWSSDTTFGTRMLTDDPDAEPVAQTVPFGFVTTTTADEPTRDPWMWW